MSNFSKIIETMSTMSQSELAALYGVQLAQPHGEVIVRRGYWSVRPASDGRLVTGDDRFVIPVRDKATAGNVANLINAECPDWCADYAMVTSGIEE